MALYAAWYDGADAGAGTIRSWRRDLRSMDDCFVAVPGDPSDTEAERLLAKLVALTRDVG